MSYNAQHFCFLTEGLLSVFNSFNEVMFSHLEVFSKPTFNPKQWALPTHNYCNR